MSPKVAPSDGTYCDSHPSLYKGNHRDYHFSFLPFLVPFSFLTIPNEHSWRNPILSSKALYTLLGVYQIRESTHTLQRVEGTKKIRRK